MTADLRNTRDRATLIGDARLQAYQGRQALVTGGLGFIGSNLVHALVALGCNVRVVDSLYEGQGGNRFNLSGIEGEIDLRLTDIRDEAAMDYAVRGSDFVFHLAGINSHLDSLSSPYNDLDVNARGTLVVLEAVRRHALEARVLYSGTRSEYGLIQTNPVREDHPLLPTEANSANRAAATLYFIAYHQAHGLRTTSLRLPNVYGPRMLASHARLGFINWFVRIAVEGGTFKLYGDGSQVRDMLYVDDCVGAFLLAGLSCQGYGEAINIGSGEPASLATIAEELVAISGHGSVEYVPFPEEARRIEIGDYVADIEKARRLLDWQPTVGLHDGLERSVRYYEAYREHYW